MKIIIAFTLMVFPFFTNTAFAISNMPPANNHPTPTISLKKKLAKADGEMTEQQKSFANLSMILGIASITLLIIASLALGAGIISLLAVLAGILAVVFGAKSLKGNSNTKGIIGVVTGGLTIALFIIAILVIIAFFASWN